MIFLIVDDGVIIVLRGESQYRVIFPIVLIFERTIGLAVPLYTDREEASSI